MNDHEANEHDEDGSTVAESAPAVLPLGQKDPFWKPFDNWFGYASETEDIVRLTHEGFSRVTSMPELLLILDPNREDDKLDLANVKAEKAQKEIDAGFPTVHAHSLLGLCGAFERFIEDLFIAGIASDPSLLSSESFSKVKVPLSVIYGLADEDRNRAILAEASRTAGFDLAGGVTRFERILDLVQLGGQVPAKIRKLVFQAIEIRNVWAHRGGVADARFVETCPDSGYAVGDKIEMKTEVFMPFMYAFNMYAVVIVNRRASQEGGKLIDLELPGFEGSLEEIADP